MLHLQLTLILFLLFTSNLYSQTSLTYPIPSKSNQTDNYFGTQVEDPYRWLENMNSKETLDWLDQEQKVLDKYKSSLSMYRAVTFGLEKLTSYNTYRTWTEKGFYFYYTNYEFEGVTIYKLNSAYDKSDGIKLISSNSVKSKHGLPLSIEDTGISEDTNFMYLNCTIASSDWNEIRVFDLKKRKLLPDIISWSKFSTPTWYKSGFFYLKYDSLQKVSDSLALTKKPNLYYHTLGTDQKEDILLNTDQNVSQLSNYYVSADSKWMIIDQIQKIDSSDFRVISSIPLDSIYLKTKQIDLYKFAKPFIIRPKTSIEDFEIIEIQDYNVYISTNFKSPTGKISLYDTRAINKFSNFIPTYKEKLCEANYVWGNFFCKYYKNGKYHTIVFDKNAKEIIQFNADIGETTYGFNDVGPDSTTLFCVESLLYPPVTFELNLKNMTVKNINKTVKYLDPEKFVTKLIEYPANDGTMIPMYLIHKKNLNLKNEKYPVLISSYGAHGINVRIDYDPTKALFLEMNGILAYPSIRGGGELGEEWHNAGKKHNKVNSFTDFINAAEYLVKSNYTDSSKIAISGASSGGLLTSACMIYRPQLFKAVISEVAAFDMIRFPKFTAGIHWINEYGNPSDSIDFKVLYSYSPYHNLKFNTNYPASLIVANENDDRVVPLHSFKFLARLQEMSLNKNPHLLLFQKKMGHNGAENYDSWIHSEAFKLCFLFKNLGIDPINFIRNNLDFKY